MSSSPGSMDPIAEAVSSYASPPAGWLMTVLKPPRVMPTSASDGSAETGALTVMTSPAAMSRSMRLTAAVVEVAGNVNGTP